jgi:signal transduction histidine kinase
MTRRLYLQIYLAFVGTLIVFGIVLAATFAALPDRGRDGRLLEGLSALLGEALPPPELDARLRRLGEMFDADITLRDPDGALLARHGETLPPPPPGPPHGEIVAQRGGPVMHLRLGDGRALSARWQHPHRRFGWLTALALLLSVIAAGAYPVVRRITGRLERLQRRVDALGEGELSARVDVEGNDEVADLARSFKRLMNAQRFALMGASHELRTPLARMRVAVDLLQREDGPNLRAQLARDIAELDELIGEILLASRLNNADRLERTETVDLLALLAEEGARVGADVSGTPVLVDGDPRMLRRLMRNLFENARRHAPGSPIEAAAEPVSGSARLWVADRGPGVPAAECERIFEPFFRSALSRERSEGHGLGLSLVKQIAQHHGGDARCRVREGGGLSFEVNLPAHPPA